MMIDIDEKEFSVISDCLDIARLYYKRFINEDAAIEIDKVADSVKSKYYKAKLEHDVAEDLAKFKGGQDNFKDS